MTRIDWVFYKAQQPEEDELIASILHRQLVSALGKVCDRLGVTSEELLAAAQELCAQRGGA